ncbi:DUF4296 domain-containing protein [Dokdonia sinensis]|nr:DUF4296 domain-containing protein [Dokdonia sinensis]
MRFLAGAILLILLLASCQSIQKQEKPENFISKEKMEQILYDVAVVNAARGYNVQLLKRNNVSPDTYIFEKYNIDSLQYAQNTAYYATDIDDYKEMYIRVEKRINKLSDSLSIEFEKQKQVEDSLKKIKSIEVRKRDSIRKLNRDTLKSPKDKSKLFSTFKVKEVLRDSL